LGWITLHSISVAYPEHPTYEDKQIASKFLELFRDTITCRYCRDHFTAMYKTYTITNPEYLNSRRDFFLFVARAHNTVNKRLDKPRPSSVVECLETLKTLTRDRTAKEFRHAYLSYLMNDWTRQMSGDGIIAKMKVKELIKINDQYWNLRDVGFDVPIWEGNVLEPIQESSLRKTPTGFTHVLQSGQVGFKGGKLRIR
jgi:hypothetical protein